METYIQISKLNDYLFCPKSLYFHSLYENFSEKIYHSEKQVNGKLHHENIEHQRYSSLKNVLQGLPVYSYEYGLMGKIDIFNYKTGELVERKYQIKKIYDGYRLQLYAQYFCLIEMGYTVNKIYLHSLSDNKRYKIALPMTEDLKFFKNIIKKIYNQNLSFKDFKINQNKCNNCIYKPLCNI